MIKLALSNAEAELVRKLLAAEMSRLNAESEAYKNGHPAVRVAISHDLAKVAVLHSELIDTIFCSHAE